MKIIIDTHIFLWALSDPMRMNKRQFIELETLSNIIYVSSVSVAEIMIKASLGKLVVDFDPVEMAEKSGFELLEFGGKDALALKDMQFHHKDPFDRMLISQSLNRKYHIMTSDSKFTMYDCQIIG